ncbi:MULTISPECIES: FecCD family ABC transporter permease [Sporosarcina]|uniref:Probable heme-iron transport system permease protein IsdF n=1 Tax=Sporosarcina psychrophila TaxID=1476 RepID=A0ABV2K3J8_SPOPS|nr:MULTISPECIES: iron ABC transporter permease [Sporosarcina]AMQ07662.1 ABC transporter permease [Sporosarcina psychrophila]QNK87386.1 iron ABC transporter permease [Sporosarcina sp. resist]
MLRKNKKALSFISVIILLILVSIQSALMGSIKVTPYELIHGLITGTNDQVAIIKDLRLPRILIALFAGAALSVAGVLLQAVMRNPLADPGIIGVSAGAGFMSIVVVAFFPTLYFFVPLFAFLGGALAFFLVYSLSWRSGLDPLRMILIGIAVNALFTGLSQGLGFSGSALTQSMSQVMTSTLTMKKWSDVDVLILYGTIGLVLSFVVYSWCNYLALDDKTAKNLGVNVNLARLVISLVAVLLASVATAVAGLFAFVGLLIPHIGRSLVGTDHKVLIPFSALAGALLILTADTLGRTIIAPNEIPASIIMAVIGGPFLIFLLRKSDRIYGH